MLCFLGDKGFVLLKVFFRFYLSFQRHLQVWGRKDVNKIRMGKAQEFFTGCTYTAGALFQGCNTVYRHPEIEGCGEFSHAIRTIKKIALSHFVFPHRPAQNVDGFILALYCTKHQASGKNWLM